MATDTANRMKREWPEWEQITTGFNLDKDTKAQSNITGMEYAQKSINTTRIELSKYLTWCMTNEINKQNK